jgi:hypothetical protein
MLPHSLQYPETTLLDYCERYVNVGTPSGFTIESQLLGSTNPFSNTRSFRLFVLSTNSFPRSEVVGHVPSLEQDDEFFLHPMMLPKFVGYQIGVRESFIHVQPTSSGRTVVTCGHPRHYIKLHFDDILGRVNRAMPFQKAVAGIEISKILERAIVGGLMGNNIGILRETGTKVVWLNAEQSAAYVHRDARFWFCGDKQVAYVVPLFSIFSNDLKVDRTVLSSRVEGILSLIRERLCKCSHTFESLFSPLIDLYFKAVKDLGLQIEFNAQNVLVAFDERLDPTGICLRDFSAIEKDYGFQSEVWPKRFLSYPYKCIYPDQQDYQVRHSFAFDFKLSTYVLHPLLSVMYTQCEQATKAIEQRMRDRIAYWISELPMNFFPSDHWFSHPKVLLTQERPYKRHANPPFRSAP